MKKNEVGLSQDAVNRALPPEGGVDPVVVVGEGGGEVLHGPLLPQEHSPPPPLPFDQVARSLTLDQ